jgi:hypothetical protein
VSVGRCRIGVVVSVYDRRLPACFCFLVRAMCMSLDKVSYDGVASHGSWSHGFSKRYFNEI